MICVGMAAAERMREGGFMDERWSAAAWPEKVRLEIGFRGAGRWSRVRTGGTSGWLRAPDVASAGL